MMNGKVLVMLFLISFIVLNDAWGRRRSGARRRRVWRKIAYTAKKVVHVVKKTIPHIKKVVKVAKTVLPLLGVGDENVFETVAYLQSLQEQDLEQFKKVMKDVEGEMVSNFGEDEAAENMKMLNDLVAASESDLELLMDGGLIEDDLMPEMQ